MQKLLLGILLVILLSGCTTEVGTITGKVLFPVITDAAYAGLGVAVVELDGEEYTYTTPDGSFVFHDVPYGRHTLTIKKGYYIAEPYEMVLTRQDLMVEIPVEIDHIRFVCKEDLVEPGQLYQSMIFIRSGIDVAKVQVSMLPDNVSEEFLSQSAEKVLFIGGLKVPWPGQEQTYTLSFTYLDEAGHTVETYDRTVIVQALNQLQVTGVDTGHPTFSWNAIAPGQSVAYKLYIGKDGHWFTIINTQDSSYTVQNELTTGAYYWKVDALALDRFTGTELAKLTSNKVNFTVP